MNRFPSLMPFQGWLLFVTQLERRWENKSIWEDDKREGEKKKKQIRQTHWNNLSDLILHPWLQEAHQVGFGSSCFPCMRFSLMLDSLSSAAPRPSIPKRLLDELHVKCIRSNMARHTVLLSHYTARCTEYFIHSAVRFEECRTELVSLTNIPLGTFSQGLKKPKNNTHHWSNIKCLKTDPTPNLNTTGEDLPKMV